MKKIALLNESEHVRLTLEMQLRAARGERDAAIRHNKLTQQAYAELQQKLDQMAAIQEPANRPAFRAEKATAQDHGISIATWSDWHVAEKVDKRKVEGLNSYSPEIAAKRAEKCALSTAKLHKHVSASYNVDSMVLFLGGDFITGYLHPELEQTNAMGPVEEAMFAQELLIGSINTLLSEKSIKNLRIVCTRGNHGRLTKKMQFKNDFETSLETMVYATLAHHFESEKRVTIDIPRGDIHHLELIKGWTLRFFHGHQIKYSDGIGGLTIPLNKWQAKQDRTRSADFNLMGHYHHYSLPNSRTILAGSLKGFDEYSLSKGFPFQEPLQAFALFDTARRMVAQHYPIFCT